VPIASYKGKVFQVSGRRVNTFDGLTWGGSLDTESQEKIGSKSSTYIRGSTLNSMSIEVPLRANLGHNVRGEIESWEKIRDSKSPDVFILGSKPIGKNKWLLKSVTVTDSQIDNSGRLLKATVKMEFEEYVRSGKNQDKQTTGAAAGTSANLVPMEIYSPPTKTEDARLNPNYTNSVMRGLFE
jgi:hypothetical protein